MGKICNICHHENDDTAMVCTSCGNLLKSINQYEDGYSKIEKIQKKVSSIYKKIVIILFIVLILLAIYFIINQNWIGFFFILLIAIITIISIIKRIIFNKVTSSVFGKINDFSKKNKKF